MRGSAGPCLGLRQLHPVRLGTLRVTVSPSQIELLAAPARSALPRPRRARAGHQLRAPPCALGAQLAGQHRHGLLVGESVRRLRVRLRLLLRARHPPLHARAAGPVAPTQPAWLDFEQRILVKTEVADVLARTLDPAKVGRRVARDRHRHRSLSARRAAVPAHPAILERLRGFAGCPSGSSRSRRSSLATSTCCGPWPRGTR